MAKKAKKTIKRSIKNVNNTNDEILTNTTRIMNMIMNTPSLLDRSALYRVLSGDRDVDSECKYPTSISSSDYQDMFDRFGPAKRVVKIFPESCWAGSPTIYETEDNNETEFEKQWKQLKEKHHILHYMQRIDLLSGIGEFGLLLVGLNDGKTLDQPVDGINLKTGEKQSNAPKERKILYLRPFSQSVIKISERNRDNKSPRYSLPEFYTIKFQDTSSSDTTFSESEVKVHWTRVIHIADNRESSEVYGTPRMKPVYNNLLDVKKTLGGSAEMFWRGGFPGISFKHLPGFEGATWDTTTMKEELIKYENSLQRHLALQGVEASMLNPVVADPTGHLKVQLMTIALTIGCPYRIFIGSEEAKLASTEDKNTWNDRVQNRRDEYVTPWIIFPIIQRLQLFGVLPETEEMPKVDWPDLDTPSDSDKAEVADKRMSAASKYVSGGVSVLIPEYNFLTTELGYDDEEAEEMLKEAEDKASDKDAEEELKKAEDEEAAHQRQLDLIEAQKSNPENTNAE